MGGGKRLLSRASSSNAQSPAIERLTVHIWLPKGYAVGAPTAIETDSAAILQWALQRCFDALRDQTSTRGPRELRNALGMVGGNHEPTFFPPF